LITEQGNGNPLVVRLSAPDNEISSPVTLAIRRDPEEVDESAVALSLVGANANKWALSLVGGEFGLYGAGLELPDDVTDENTLFLIRAKAVVSDSPQNDYSVQLQVTSGEDTTVFQLCRQVYSTITKLAELEYTMQAKTLSDTCSAVLMRDVAPKDRFDFTVGDLPISMVISDVETIRKKRRVTLTYDHDDIYLKPIAIVGKVTANQVMQTVASAFGKTLHSHFDDFEIAPVDDKATYSDVLSRLFGWTANLPHQQVNVFIRGSHLWVVQRGMEPTVRTLGEHGEIKITDTYERGVLTYGTDNESNDTSSAIAGDSEDVYLNGSFSSGGASVTFVNGLAVSRASTTATEATATSYSYSAAYPPARITGENTTITSLIDAPTRHISVSRSYSTGPSGDKYVGIETTVETVDSVVVNTTTTYYSSLGQGMFARTVVVNGKTTQSDIQRGAPTGDASPVVIGQYSKGERPSAALSGRFAGDARFDVTDQETINRIAEQLEWRSTAKIKKLSCEAYGSHIYDYNERVSFGGNEYFLDRNNVKTADGSRYVQSLLLARWYQ